MTPLSPSHDKPITGAGRAPLIVHVVRQYAPSRGGLEDVVANLAREGLKKGYRIRVVTLDRVFSDPETPLAARETIDGIEVVRIGWRGSRRYPVAPSVLKHIGDADLVHVHAIDFFFDFLALTRVLHGKTMIATTHGGFFHTQKFAALKAVWFQTLTRFSASRYRFVVGCSQSDTETFAPIVGARLRMVENGADVGKFADAAAKSPTKRLITIGRFSVNKRLDRLIATMGRLVKTDPEWRLDIVGVAADQSVADLERLIAAQGVTDNVAIHAGLDNSAIAALIGQGSYFASASEYEGFGLVAIEAMSAGLVPLLQPNAAYQRLAAAHGGIALVDFDAPQDAADAIRAADVALGAGRPDRRQLIETAGLYSWNTVSARYFALYQQALS